MFQVFLSTIVHLGQRLLEGANPARVCLLGVHEQPADVWVQTREFNASARKTPDLGFLFDPTNVTAEIGQCQSVYDEYMVGLMDGTRPIADYQEMLAEYKAAGPDRIIAKLQRQIDAWKASR